MAAAALAGGCHYVDPGGYTPLFPILSSRRPEIRAKRLTFLLTLGILPGLSELFPVYVARTCFDRVEGFEYACVGRDRWTFPSAWDIAWGVGNIGNGLFNIAVYLLEILRYLDTPVGSPHNVAHEPVSVHNVRE